MKVNENSHKPVDQIDGKLGDKLSALNPVILQEIESWIVNSVKVKMIKKYDENLTTEGKLNLRKLFLVPVFTISELSQRIEDFAPEMKTVYYKELVIFVEQAEKRFV